jgi:hypothetical protein
MAKSTSIPAVFRRWTDNGEVIALFPTLPADYAGHCTSYMQVGQHGAADYDAVIELTRPVFMVQSDAATLARELEQIGYDFFPCAAEDVTDAMREQGYRFGEGESDDVHPAMSICVRCGADCDTGGSHIDGPEAHYCDACLALLSPERVRDAQATDILDPRD